MNTIEEQLWNYIDGNCTAVEKAEIEAKLAIDLRYQEVYEDLLAVNNELKQLDFEEPSLSFTRNVMEKVNQELRPVALKTKIDHRIIYTIAGFFIASILSIFAYAIVISDVNFSFEMPKINFNTDKIINPVTIQLFVFIDVALALVYLDSYLRKGKIKAQKKGE